MAIDSNSRTHITGFDRVPDLAKGKVRDLRVRWALEEMGRDYQPQLFDVFGDRPPDYRQWHPFGQVPAFDDGEVRLFELGAILLYLGEQDERLLPREGQQRWDTVSWLIAALNSVEPMLMQLVSLDFFNAGQAWTDEARPGVVEQANARLTCVAEALGEKDWLTGQFSIADITMVTVMRSTGRSDLLEAFHSLGAYRARGMDRPAFKQAIADQMAGFTEPNHQGA